MAILSRSGHTSFTVLAIISALTGCANAPNAGAQDTAPTADISEDPASSPSAVLSAQPSPRDAHIAEASQRFDIPDAWIRAVMQAESAGDPHAVSPKGAMGLMQVMPGTWAELRAQHGLGSDPFNPRDNILAGTAYLRQMHNRFGEPGFLAAYNAGPGRYAEHLRTGRPLPRETRTYVARLSRALGFDGADPLQRSRTARAVEWHTAPLFVGSLTAAYPRSSDAQGDRPRSRTEHPRPSHRDLFVIREQEDSR